MNSNDESIYHPWAARFQEFEQKYHSHDPNLQSELEQFIWRRLLGFEGPSIDVLHGEEPADILNWMLNSAGEQELGKRMREAMLAILRRELPGIHEQDDVQRVAVSDLLGLIETGMPSRVMFGDVTWRTASYLRGRLCHQVDGDDRLGRWYQTRSPTGIPLLSRLLRTFALLQRDGSLAPFWMDLLKNESAPDVAIAAFDGLSRSVENDARVAWPFLVHALSDAPDKLTRAIISFCRRNYLLKKNGEQPASIQWHREIFDEGDVAVMFQPIPPGNQRTEYVEQVCEYLIREKEITEAHAKHFTKVALQPPPRYVFLDSVDSYRFCRWPAFHLMHWPVWAHRWVEQYPEASIEAAWINLDLTAVRVQRLGIGQKEGMVASGAPNYAGSMEDRTAPIDQGLYEGDRFNLKKLRENLRPIQKRWEPAIILSPAKVSDPMSIVDGATVIPPELEPLKIDRLLRRAFPDDPTEPIPSNAFGDLQGRTWRERFKSPTRRAAKRIFCFDRNTEQFTFRKRYDPDVMLA